MGPSEGLPGTGLRLGVIPGATPDKWAARWRKRFPDVPLHVERFEDEGQLERVRTGAVDVGYLRLREGEVEALDSEIFHRVVLYREDPVVCAAREHWVAAAEESVAWEDIAEESFLDATQAEDGESMALEVVASGAGLLMLPHSVARMLSRKDVVIRRVDDAPGFDVALCWRRDRDDAVIQEFIGVARGRRSGSGRSGRGDGAPREGTVRPAASRAASEPRRRRRRPGSPPGPPPRGRRRSRRPH